MRTLVACFLFISVLSVVHSAIVRVCVDYDAIYPTSSYLQPGDTLQFYGTNASESHWIVTVLPNFSAPNFTGQILSPQQFGGLFQYNVNLTDDITQQGVVWSDLFNPPTSAFGVAYVARTSDVVITWNVFQYHPPGPSYNLSTQYPLKKNIRQGTRVIWDSSLESLLNHPVLFADRSFHATIGCPFSHPFVSNRNFNRFGWTFDLLGSFNFVCGVHSIMTGTVRVLPSTATDAELADYSWTSASATSAVAASSPYGCY